MILYSLYIIHFICVKKSINYSCHYQHRVHSFKCFCLVIDHESHHNTVKVAEDPPGVAKCMDLQTTSQCYYK